MKSSTPPPAAKLTLAEMAAQQAASIAPAPLNAALNATRYLGARAPDKRKVCTASFLLSRLACAHTYPIRSFSQRSKIGGKKVDFDWDRTDDTGATEVDPLYAPYIPPTVAKGRNDDRYDSRGGGGGGRGGRGGGGRDEPPSQQQRGGLPVVVAAQGKEPKIGLYGRGMLAGFDREAIPGKKTYVPLELPDCSSRLRPPFLLTLLIGVLQRGQGEGSD